MNKKDNVASVIASDAEVVPEQTPVTAVAVRDVSTPTPSSGLGCVMCVGGPAVLNWTWVHLKFEMSKSRPDGNQGEFYLGQDWEAKLCDKGGNLGVGQVPDESRRFEFVVVGRHDGYKHYLTQVEFSAGKSARRYFVDPSKGANGWAEARKVALAAGETIGNGAWRDGDPSKGEPARVGPTASEFMQLLVLVKRPKNLCGGDELFSIPLDGEFYAPAYLEFDKLNWLKAYNCLQSVINTEVNKSRVDPKYVPCLFDKVFWGFSSAVTRPGRNGAKDKVVTTPMMVRAVADGKPVTLSKKALEDIVAIVREGAAPSEEGVF